MDTPSQRIADIKQKLALYEPIYSVKNKSCCSVSYKFMYGARDDINFLLDCIDELVEAVEEKIESGAPN